MRVSPRKPLRVRGAHRRPFGVACALLLACGALASSATAAGTVDADGSEAVLGSSASSGSAPGGPVLPSTGGPSATLEQCFTSGVQAERSATFLAEMTATPGTGRMSMRIELQERPASEVAFRNVAAPGLGVWRAAAPGVKVYRYIKQVTNLSAPAVYRAAVRFRWLNTKGKLIRGVERRTTACVQPAGSSTAAATTPAGA
jgi:hypothetical protein